jgi:DNA-binding FadR family transcriptional regulator
LSDGQTMAGPITRRKTYELVAERLLAPISSRSLAPGDLLPPERELVQLFRVGRSSVREALRMLESKGVIVSGGNGAFAVAHYRNPLDHSLDFLLSVEEADHAELFEVRRIVEGEAAALAASRRRPAQVDAMEEAVGAMAAGLGSEQAFIGADLRFHLLVAEATGNRLIVHLMNAIRALLHRSLSSAYRVPGSPERAIQMHRLILGAVRDGRPEDARRLMREHVTRVERDITGNQPGGA